jgi:hypothetical protein
MVRDIKKKPKKNPETLKSLYRSPGYKKRTNWSYVKTMSCSGSHLGIPINIKNTKFVKDLPMIDFQLSPPYIYDLRWWLAWISNQHKKN